MNKKQVVELAIETLGAKVESLDVVIEKEKQKKQVAPSAMESWSDNTRFEKEILISRLEEDREVIKKHIGFLKSLDFEAKKQVEQGSLIEIKNAATKEKGG